MKCQPVPSTVSSTSSSSLHCWSSYSCWSINHVSVLNASTESVRSRASKHSPRQRVSLHDDVTRTACLANRSRVASPSRDAPSSSAMLSPPHVSPDQVAAIKTDRAAFCRDWMAPIILYKVLQQRFQNQVYVHVLYLHSCQCLLTLFTRFGQPTYLRRCLSYIRRARRGGMGISSDTAVSHASSSSAAAAGAGVNPASGSVMHPPSSAVSTNTSAARARKRSRYAITGDDLRAVRQLPSLGASLNSVPWSR